MSSPTLQNLPTIKKSLGSKSYQVYKLFFHQEKHRHFAIIPNQAGSFDIFAPGGEYIASRNNLQEAKIIVERLDKIDKLKNPLPPPNYDWGADLLTEEWQSKMREGEIKRMYDIKYRRIECIVT